MRILFDQGVPVPLRKHFSDSEVTTLVEQGWSTLTNGELIAQAEDAGFDCLVTTDKNLQYQQNLKNRRIAIAVLPTPSWPALKSAVDRVVAQILSTSAGDFVEIDSVGI